MSWLYPLSLNKHQKVNSYNGKDFHCSLVDLVGTDYKWFFFPKSRNNLKIHLSGNCRIKDVWLRLSLLLSLLCHIFIKIPTQFWNFNDFILLFLLFFCEKGKWIPIYNILHQTLPRVVVSYVQLSNFSASSPTDP